MGEGSNAVSEAIILAGGAGTRLRSVVADRPKPLAPVLGRPFLEWVLRSLARQGVERSVLAVGYRAEQIREHFGDGSALGMDLSYSEETTPLGTGGALRLAVERVRGPRVFVVNADSICDAQLALLERRHVAERASLTLWVSPVPDAARFGSVELDADDWVSAFREKTSLEAAAAPGASTKTSWVNAGVFLAETELIRQSLTLGRSASLELELLAKMPTRTMLAVRGQRPLLDIGTPGDYASAERVIQELAGAAPGARGD